MHPFLSILFFVKHFFILKNSPNYAESDNYKLLDTTIKICYHNTVRYAPNELQFSLLYATLNISREEPGLKPYVNNYNITVFDIAYLDEEQVAMFQSDFKFIAQYFVQKRLHHDYQPSDEVIIHVDALLKMFTALTGDRRYEFI